MSVRHLIAPVLLTALLQVAGPMRGADQPPAPAISGPDAPVPPPAAPVREPEATPLPPAVIALDELKRGEVRVEVFEIDPATAPKPAPEITEKSGKKAAAKSAPPSWAKPPSLKTDEYAERAFGFGAFVEKYDAQGIRVDRSEHFLLRAAAVVTLPQGAQRLLVRSLSGARLALDGRTIATTEMGKQRGGDAEAVPDQLANQLVKEMRLLPAGHREAMATVESDGQPHVVTLEVFVGGPSIRPEIGETSVSVAVAGQPFCLLTPDGSGLVQPMTQSGWRAYAEAQIHDIARLNAERRRNAAEELYWKTRHDLARQHAKPAPAVPSPRESLAGRNAIDRFVGARLEKAGAEPAALIGDAAFLRRVTLDTVGLLPTSEEVEAFLADAAPDKRSRAIDRLLADTRWADRWVPYWQDVLAENPGMLKATLANSGPFRYWIYEALYDNKPMDRFVTELIAMQGSALYGGTSGFGVSSQNDLPMAAKAQIVSSAFLGMEMKCARCHDAPYHPFNQEDLFNIAAMLQRAPLKVPGTSLTAGLSANSHVTVSLKTGQEVAAHFPFKDLNLEPLPGVLRKPDDTREQLAAILTDPRNTRFSQVMVNRLWKELFGAGIVDPVEDWENASPADPDLLAWLGHEFTTHDFDLKHLARLILNSEAYQRSATAAASRTQKPEERLFAGPARRRLTAESLVDSLFALCGKDFDCEPMTMDPENRQSAKDHSNIGVPRRAWQFTGLANERDRPALAKPHALVVTDVLSAFGWRESRSDPRSTRDLEANVLQPALLANGTLGARIIRLDDTSAFTELALRDQPVEQLVRELFLRTLSRPPSESELVRFRGALEPGYDARRTGAPAQEHRPGVTKAVSWANHLNGDATNVVLAIEKEVKAGDPPTQRLQNDWRERMEDVLWALILSPEFMHLP
jgi:hypothetical protein